MEKDFGCSAVSKHLKQVQIKWDGCKRETYRYTKKDKEGPGQKTALKMENAQENKWAEKAFDVTCKNLSEENGIYIQNSKT